MLSAISKLGAASLRQVSRGAPGIISVAKMSNQPNYETLSVTVPKEFVYHVELNRPDKLNAFNSKLWTEMGQCFEHLNTDENCRVIVLSGSGRLFTAGLDLNDAMKVGAQLAEVDDVARKAKVIYNNLTHFQKSISAVEICKKPVLAAVHGACVGAGINLVSTVDMRYCTKDAFFQVKEVDIGMAADLGALQRLPKIIGSDSLTRELCYTGRKFPANEALDAGLVSKVYEDKDSMIKEVVGIAESIAKKSPVAVQVTKASLVYSRDHTVEDSLQHIAILNQLMLQSEDFATGTIAQATKQTDVAFAKL